MTICETLKRLLSGVERITKNMNKNRALSIDSGTKEIAPPLPRDPMAGAAKDRLTVDRFPVLVERLRREGGGWMVRSPEGQRRAHHVRRHGGQLPRLAQGQGPPAGACGTAQMGAGQRLLPRAVLGT
jgi:hypothetical protein